MVDARYHLSTVKANKSAHKSVLVAKELIRAIRAGAFALDGRLPSERSLARIMGVSRAAVREALSALQVVGVIETYVGDGTYVRSRSHLGQRVFEDAVGILETEGNLEDWLEAREVIEAAVARHAIRSADERDIERMDAILDDMRAAIECFDVDGYLASDLQFHTALFHASHNETLRRTASDLLASMQQRLWKTLKRNYYTRARLLANSHRRHRRIVEALRERDGDAMTRAVWAHFRFLNDEVEDE